MKEEEINLQIITPDKDFFLLAKTGYVKWYQWKKSISFMFPTNYRQELYCDFSSGVNEYKILFM